MKKELNSPITGYDSWEDVAHKIEWEGGTWEFFLGYRGGKTEDINDLTLNLLVQQLANASVKLEVYLSKVLPDIS
jgi:hypothetical protein